MNTRGSTAPSRQGVVGSGYASNSNRYGNSSSSGGGPPDQPRRDLRSSPPTALRSASSDSSPTASNTAPRVPSISVLDLRLAHPTNSGPTVAYCTIRIGPLEVRDVRLVHPQNKIPFVVPPQSSWEDKVTGERKYRDLIVWPRPWADAITKAVLVACREQGLDVGPCLFDEEGDDDFE